MAKQPDSSLRGSTVLITGAGRGIGRLYAERLAANGASVVLVSRSTKELAEVAATITKRREAASHFTVDVTDTVAVQHLVERVEDEVGAIDVLINNAGVRGPVGNAWECAWDGWWRTIEVNLGGAVAFTHAVIPKMAARRKGRVVNIVSEAGVYRWPTVSAYSVSKAALIKFTENLASECRDLSLSVFAYHPGLLPIGLAADVQLQASMTPAEAKVAAWCRAQLESAGAASPDQSATQLVSLLSGAYDNLSGRYITVHDDLDALLTRVRDKYAYNDYLMLRPQR